MAEPAPPLKSWPALDLSRALAPAADADVADHLAAFLDDYSPTAIVDTSSAMALAWRVFFATPDAREAAARALAVDRADVAIVALDVPDEQWAERSQASLRAIRVGRLVVAPPWDIDSPDTVGDEADTAAERGATVLVVIEPSMGFGTGHHESTRLCLRALQRLDLAGRLVIDLGTGSGVLAIAAARLGCDRVIALDDDPDAAEAARANVARNRVDDRVEVRHADLGADLSLRGDVVLGNLTGGLLRRLAGAVAERLAPGATLVLSGFTEDERLAVADAFEPLRVVGSDTEHGWVALTLS